MFIEIDKRITDKIPIKDLVRIVMGMKEGYSIAYELINAIDFLKVDTAKSRYQDLFNFACDYFLQEKCKHGIISLSSKTEWNTRHNCQHIVLFNDRISLTLSSVHSLEQFPRKAVFRQQKASDQVKLWDDNPLNSVEYGIITHKRCRNKKDEVFPMVQIGIPNTECDCWELQYSLSELPSVDFTSHETKIDIESTISIKENIIKENTFKERFK